MLYDHKGKEVKLHPRFNSKQNPNVFIPLREVKEPSHDFPKGMASIGSRAKFKQ